jgi:hypothetical protein
MTYRHCPSIATLALIAVCSVRAAAPEPEKVTARVSVGSLHETRVKAAMADSYYQKGLRVELQFEDFLGMTHQGHVEVTRATDDLGTDLRSTPATAVYNVTRDSWLVVRRGPSHMQQRVSFHVESSPRRARTISLQGRVRLLVASGIESFELKDPAKRIDTKVEHKLLDAAGVELRLVDTTPDAKAVYGSSALALELKGNPNAVLEVQVLDKQGQYIGGGSTGTTRGATAAWTYDLKKPLSEAGTVSVYVALGQKPIVVAFDLKDIELP